MLKNNFICDCNMIHKNEVEEVINIMPSCYIFNDLAKLFKLIGDNTRCKILFALDKKKLCVCDIASVLNMTKSAVSHQLAILRENNIVKCEKSGKEVYYSLDDDHIVKLFEVGFEHITHMKENNYEENI